MFVPLSLQSKLSKSDHKLKKNVMFNLHHASKSLIDKNYRNAIKLYETALNEIEKSKVGASMCVTTTPIVCHLVCICYPLHVCCSFTIQFILAYVSFTVLFCSVLCNRHPHVCHLLCCTLQTQWHSIMTTSEHNRLMVTVHYCLGLAVWLHRRENYIITAMSHFRTITTRYSSIIFIPAYYYLGMANAALHQ